jgi:hypothetical protein
VCERDAEIGHQRLPVVARQRNHTDDRISTFSVHPDGRHFVVTHPLGEPVTLIVVTNRLSDVRAKRAAR